MMKRKVSTMGIAIFVVFLFITISVGSQPHYEIQKNTSNTDIITTTLYGFITNVEKNETKNVITAQAIYVWYHAEGISQEYSGEVHHLTTIQFKDGVLVHITNPGPLGNSIVFGFFVGEIVID